MPIRDKKVTEKRLYHLSANGKRRAFCEKAAQFIENKEKEIFSRRQGSVNK